MDRKPYQPEEPAELDARIDGGRWTLVFVRELGHAPERVWRAITDPDALREWAPFDADRDLGGVGKVTLTMAGPDPEKFESTVRCAQAPQLLEYTWGDDLLRWELEPTPSGTRLTLLHAVQEKGWLPKVGAGWHICFDVMDRWLRGAPIGRIVGEDAMNYGWARLNDAYAARLGIEG